MREWGPQSPASPANGQLVNMQRAPEGLHNAARDRDGGKGDYVGETGNRGMADRPRR